MVSYPSYHFFLLYVYMMALYINKSLKQRVGKRGMGEGGWDAEV